MTTSIRRFSVSRGASVLAIYVIASLLAIGIVHTVTRDRIEASRARLMALRLAEVLPQGLDMNASALEPLRLQADAFGSSEPQLIHRFQQDNVSTAVISTVAPDGYNGPVRLLVGLDENNRLTGVRVSEHAETPGLGDDIDAGRSDWILQFTGVESDRLSPGDWRIIRQGGRFDGMTGATVTSSAVINAVERAARWMQTHNTQVFTEQ